ncbi:hypothetical protein WDW86_00650 [Bdellovibrionota bacterium FG-2]
MKFHLMLIFAIASLSLGTGAKKAQKDVKEHGSPSANSLTDGPALSTMAAYATFGG